MQYIQLSVLSTASNECQEPRHAPILTHSMWFWTDWWMNCSTETLLAMCSELRGQDGSTGTLQCHSAEAVRTRPRFRPEQSEQSEDEHPRSHHPCNFRRAGRRPAQPRPGKRGAQSLVWAPRFFCCCRVHDDLPCTRKTNRKSTEFKRRCIFILSLCAVCTGK